MKKIAIVVACFNRPKSLKRVLGSLGAAKYPAQPVELIVSIDYSEDQEHLSKVAEDFEWPYGPKTVRAFDERQGLRSHILQCGDLSFDRDGIIVLEDDIVVGENFYRYAIEAVSAVGSDSRIAGISLYAPKINEMAALPFQPAPSEFDGYFLQSSQSWGQCWTTQMWKAFREWLPKAPMPLLDEADMPSRIYSWPETSWKKYHMKYTVEMDLTWLYPYISHSSNCSDVGTHNPRPSFLFQVPLSCGNRQFVFPKHEDNTAVHYDVFFERNGVTDQNGIPLVLDLYGTRRIIREGSRFVTRRLIKLTPVRGYGLSLQPHDENIVRSIVGDDFQAFDANQSVEMVGKVSARQKVYYSNLTWRDALQVGLTGFIQAIPDKARRSIRQIWSVVMGKHK